MIKGLQRYSGFSFGGSSGDGGSGHNDDNSILGGGNGWLSPERSSARFERKRRHSRDSGVSIRDRGVAVAGTRGDFDQDEVVGADGGTSSSSNNVAGVGEGAGGTRRRLLLV